MQCLARWLRGVRNHEFGRFKILVSRLDSRAFYASSGRCEPLATKTGSRSAVDLDNIVCRSRGTMMKVSRLPVDYFSMQFSSKAENNDDDVKRKIEDLTDKVKDAMELLDDARSSSGTVYFTDDMTDAETSVKEVFSEYEDLLKSLNEDQKQNVVRRIGLKMEELKAHIQMLKESSKS